MIGKTISHYRIIEKLGAGGMGVVYKGEDTKLKRTVALKFLPPTFSLVEELKKRFIQEVQGASFFQHSNICTIHDIDETKPAPGEPIFLCEAVNTYGVSWKSKDRIIFSPNEGNTISWVSSAGGIPQVITKNS